MFRILQKQYVNNRERPGHTYEYAQ